MWGKMEVVHLQGTMIVCLMCLMHYILSGNEDESSTGVMTKANYVMQQSKNLHLDTFTLNDKLTKFHPYHSSEYCTH